VLRQYVTTSIKTYYVRYGSGLTATPQSNINPLSYCLYLSPSTICTEKSCVRTPIWCTLYELESIVFSSCRFVLFFTFFVCDWSVKIPLFIFVLCCWSNLPIHYMDDLVDWMFFIYFFPFLLHPLSYADISIWYTLNQYVITLFLSFFFLCWFVELNPFIWYRVSFCPFCPDLFNFKKKVYIYYLSMCVYNVLIWVDYIVWPRVNLLVMLRFGPNFHSFLWIRG